jgi:LysM repeat protein
MAIQISLIPSMFCGIVAFFLALQPLDAKPPYHLYKTHATQPTTQKAAAGQTSQQTSYNDLQHELENHELEIRMFEERLNAQETILDSLRQQFLDSTLSQQEMVKGNAISIEKRVGSVETGVSGIGEDLRELQTHANDTSKVLAQYKQRISELEKQIGSMQNAVETLLTALQIDDVNSKDSSQVYEVKSGDKLEKIARNYKTSVKKIKELNSLTDDRIKVGQKLKIP